MPFAKKYETYEVRSLMQTSEGAASPVTGAAAHSRGLHVSASPGGVGTDAAAMMVRTHKQLVVGGTGPGGFESNAQFGGRGGKPKTSAFSNLIQQCSAVTQALNSPRGQAAMAVLDDANHAAAPLRVTLKIAGIRQAGFLAATPAPRASSVHKSEAAVSGMAGDGVLVIIDRGANATTMMVQTCYPLANVAGGNSYQVMNMATNAVVAAG